jgi:hypothetical protein
MKKKYFLPIVLLALFVQCSKDKGDNLPVELTKGLLAIDEIRLGTINSVSWHGSLDEMRYYNRVLNAKEIAVLAKQ